MSFGGLSSASRMPSAAARAASSPIHATFLPPARAREIGRVDADDVERRS